MSELLGKYYDKETTKLFESVINKLLRKKYQWFDRIIINNLSYSKSQNYLGIDADLFADEDWVGNQWREFYYSKPMPSGTEDDPIVLGEMIGDELSKELQDDFKTVFVFITSERRPKYMSHSWIVVKPIEMNDKNLQENILRIKEVMFLNEANEEAVQHIQKQIDKKISELKSVMPNSIKSVLNPEKIINDVRNYLFSRIPEIIEKSKTGKGGEQFAYECYTKLMEIVQNEINNISTVKKYTLRALAPKKQEFLNISNNVDTEPFFSAFVSIVDFSFMIGWMSQYKNVNVKMLDFSNQISNWITKNKKTITNSVINKVSNFLYD